MHEGAAIPEAVSDIVVNYTEGSFGISAVRGSDISPDCTAHVQNPVTFCDIDYAKMKNLPNK